MGKGRESGCGLILVCRTENTTDIKMKKPAVIKEPLWLWSLERDRLVKTG